VLIGQFADGNTVCGNSVDGPFIEKAQAFLAGKHISSSVYRSNR